MEQLRRSALALASGLLFLLVIAACAEKAAPQVDTFENPGLAPQAHAEGLFELDVNTSVDPAVGDANTIDDPEEPTNPTTFGDDWVDVFNGTSGAFASVFIEDSFANNPIEGWEDRTPEVSFFTGGGSKDTRCIQDPCEGAENADAQGGPWLYDTVNDQVPDKNDIVNAFAAAYEDPDDGNTIFYFGLDTYAEQGSNNVGFWFFREPVTLDPLEPGEMIGDFNGEHSIGDIFVAAEFTGGGRVETIQVYRWDGTGLVQEASGASCATEPLNDDVCGVANKSDHLPPYPYLDKNATNDYDPATFVEFGLDINAILGEDIGCFSSFLAETRSSQSTTAQLKDFALGFFEVCGIEVTKEGPELSKVGDEVEYTVTITNTGRATLYKESITDSLAGDLTDGTNSAIISSECGASLASGASCTIIYSYIVQENDPDPLVNTVTIKYDEEETLDGLEFTDDDSHEVNLFQPSITFDKTGDTLSKVGDDVNYVLTLNNTSSADTPDLECTITDALLNLNRNVTLTSGASDVTNESYTVLENDSDPLMNTANVECSPIGFENIIPASDSHEVDLFQPTIEVIKTGDELSKVGDTVTYNFTINNTSSAGTPILNLVSVSDTVLGDLTADADANGCATLGLGESCSFSVDRVVQDGDADPLPNTVTVLYNPDGFTNEVTDFDEHEVNLFQPAISLDKSGPDIAKVGDEITYTFQLTNQSSADTPALVNCELDDPTLGITDEPITPGVPLNVPYTIPDDAADPLVNTATVTCGIEGFDNEIEASDDHSVNLFEPSVEIIKDGDELSKVGDTVTYEFEIENTSSLDSPDLNFASITDTLLDDAALSAAASDANCGTLAPGASCNFSLDRVVQDGDADPLPNTVTVLYNPDGFTNEVTDFDEHEVNLFQPAISLDKSGPDIAKVGDEITYSFLLTDESSDDTPELVNCVLNDPLLGILDQPITPGAAFETPYEVPADAADPLVNEATVTCGIEGFDNEIEASNDYSVDLFGPTVEITKTGDELSKVGDTVTYEFEIENTSSDGSPDLNLVSVMDDVLGDLTELATDNGCATLVQGASCNFSVDREVQADDVDPLPNTVTVTYNPENFPNIIEASDGHSVELFQPSITFEKTGDELSKEGDEVDYVLTLNNTSSADTPNLECTITDTLLGVDKNVTLASGEQDVTNASYTVQVGDPDPLPNTASVECSPIGFENIIPVSDDHSVELFQPSVEITKTGDELSKVGDTVTYEFEIENTSSDDSPSLILASITDTLLDDAALAAAASAAGCDTLVPGATCNFTVDREVQAGDADPLPNTVTVLYNPEGFDNEIEASDDHSVELFQPAISLDKSGDAFSKVGDEVNYTFLLTNNSSPDTPALVNCVLNDPLLGITNQSITPGVAFEASYNVPGGAADPLVNTAEVKCGIEGFDNIIDASDSHNVDLVNPSFTVEKLCTNEPVSQDGPATWDILVSNTGDVALVITLTDDDLPGGSTEVPLAAGASTTVSVSRVGNFAGQATVSNTVNASAVIDPSVGTFTNVIAPDESTAECVVASRVELLKTTDGVVDPNFDWQFAIYNGPNEGNGSGFLGSPIVSDTSSGDSDGVLEFGDFDFDPDGSYTICELNTEATAGWTQNWTLNGSPITPYNPHSFDDPPEDLGARCYDFTFNTGGETLNFTVDNIRPPGGNARTPGYWRNWSSCTNGNQYTKATSGDPDGEFTALDELLQTNTYDLGDLILGTTDGNPMQPSADCGDAVAILSHRDIDSDRNRANDAAYKLARNLLAYELNQDAGAEFNQTAEDAAIAAHALLDEIGFDGTGRYLRPRDALYSDAIELAGILDAYNNNLLP